MTVIVSLSTIPTRFDKIGPVLDGLLKQTAKVDEIQLYIPKRYKRFPDYDGALPDVPDGVRIVQPDEDLGPASKVLFAAREYRGTDTTIIYCDDDKFFEPDRFARMIAAHQERPECCIVANGGHLATWGQALSNPLQPRARVWRKTWDYRAKRVGQMYRQIVTGKKLPKPFHPVFEKSGYVDIAMGYGGVLIKPDFFDDETYQIPAKLWAVDDIWLSGQLARNDHPIWLVSGFAYPARHESGEVDALLDSVIDGADRLRADMACIAHMQNAYGIWL